LFTAIAVGQETNYEREQGANLDANAAHLVKPFTVGDSARSKFGPVSRNMPPVNIQPQHVIYSVSQKKVAPLKLFAIFSLRLSIFP